MADLTAPRLTLALLGAVLALLVAETLARLHGDRLCLESPGVVYERDARFGWSHVPGISGRVGTCRTTRVPMVPLDVDAHGLVGPARARAKPAGTARILLLGGNGPEGLGVLPAERLAPLLEGLADRRRGTPLEVLNAAVGGFVLDNDLLYFRAEGRRYAPDVVLVVLDPTSELVALSPRLIYVSGQTAPAKPTFRLTDDRLELLPLAGPPATDVTPAPLAGLGRFQLYRLWRDQPRRLGPALAFTQGDAPPDGTAVDLPAEQARARALARALLAALRDETRAAGATLVAAIGPIRSAAWDPEGGQDDEALRTLARKLAIPTVDLGTPFRLAENTGRRVYVPGSGRWGPDGHFVASQAIWHFLTVRQLLPAGVVSVVAIGGGRDVGLGDLGHAIPELVWRERASLGVGVVLFGLAGVALLWMGAVLPAAAREWLGVAVGVALIAALGARWFAPAALAVALAWWAAVELLPRPVSLPAVLLLAAGAAVVPLTQSPPLLVGTARDPRLFFVLAGGVLLLRLVGYAVARRQGAPRATLREFLEATFFFPTLLFGPVESVARHRAGRAPDAVAPASFAALRRHLGAATLGAGRVVLGAAALVLATGVVGLISPDVWQTAGRGVGRMRLWLWLGELPLDLYLLAAGVGEIAIGLGAMAGVRVGENFRAPWAARDAADFWRRWLTSIGEWLKRCVYQPVRASRGPTLGVIAAFLASLLWLGWMGGTFFHGAGPLQMPVGLLAWSAMNAAAVLLVRHRPGRATSAASLAIVFLSWMPLSLPPGLGLGTCASILLRLAGLR